MEQAKEAEPVEEPAILQEEELEDEPPELADAPDDSNSEEGNDKEEPEVGIASRTRSHTGAVRQLPKRYTIVSESTKRQRERPKAD